MKTLQLFTLIIFGSSTLLTSCKKEDNKPSPKPSRTIEYNLFTEKDLSSDPGIITFSIFIRNHDKVLFDSTFAAMKIKDIPPSDNKLTIKKLVPENDQSDLSVGFHYAIENVGQSSHLDTSQCRPDLQNCKFFFPVRGGEVADH